MINVVEFRKWLIENTNYSSATINDIVSRVKRADRILTWDLKDTYMYYLENNEEFAQMTASVKSQIRLAVKYYTTFYSKNIIK